MPKETILIFDQEPHTRWILKALLESERYIVIALQDIDRLKQNFREFEISGLITEYWAGTQCMVDHIRELKKAFPDLYVMMLTHQEVEDKEYKRILISGVDDLFMKPFSSEKVLLHLKRGLRLRRLKIQKRRMEKELMKQRLIDPSISSRPLGMNLKLNK
ncbi:MAG: response regulator [Thermodesulfobacteriota bacterium]